MSREKRPASAEVRLMGSTRSSTDGPLEAESFKQRESQVDRTPWFCPSTLLAKLTSLT